MPAARIPIAAAERIARDYGQQQVIFVTWDGETTHVVTYGDTALACRQAAEGGNRVKRALGWPESLCNAKPRRTNALKRQLRLAADVLREEAPVLKGLADR